MDPLTLSLNSLRPVAIRALVLLACRFPEARAAQQALCVVGEHVGNGDPSLAVAAAMGEATGRLYDSQRQWIEEYAGAIHGGDAPLTDWQQVALSTALSVHRVHPGLLTLLRPSFVVTIERMISENLTAGWLTHDRSFPQLIGDWLMTAVISGWLEPDDSLVALWFERTGAELRGEVMDHLGWQLSRSEEVPVAVLTAAAELWDKRAEHVRAHTEDAIELSGVYWFVHSEKYPTEWWLPRLEYASSVIPDYDMHGMVGEQLAAASRSDPGTSVSVLENVFQTRIMGNAHTHYDLMERAVPQVIASALDSGDVELGKRAIGLMNRLGADGYILLKDRVEMLRT